MPNGLPEQCKMRCSKLPVEAAAGIDISERRLGSVVVIEPPHLVTGMVVGLQIVLRRAGIEFEAAVGRVFKIQPYVNGSSAVALIKIGIGKVARHWPTLANE